MLPKPTLQVADTCTGKMGGVNLSINKMEFSLAISQLLLVQLGKFVDTIIFEIVEHYCSRRVIDHLLAIIVLFP